MHFRHLHFELILLLMLDLYICKIYSAGPRHPTAIRHSHPQPSSDVKLTKDYKILHDAEHLKEDMTGSMPRINVDQMTDAEMEFHYFKIHDYDGNLHLDGLEIYQALLHTTYPLDVTGKHILINEEESAKVIDRVLEEDDTNNDGYLSYTEYIIGREKEKQNNA